MDHKGKIAFVIILSGHVHYEFSTQIVKPKSALVVVDVQNDFISGSLAIKNCPAGQNGEEVVPPINTLLGMVEWINKINFSFYKITFVKIKMIKLYLYIKLAAL